MNTFATVAAIAVTALSIVSTSTAKIEAEQPSPEPIVEQVQVIIKEDTFKEKLVKADLVEKRKLVLGKITELTKGTSVNPNVVYGTIAKCENTPLDTNLQSGHRYKYNNKRWGILAGEREKSFGLAMIHLPDHPTITHAEATDPEFALSWMVQEFQAGRASQWTCWRNLYRVN